MILKLKSSFFRKNVTNKKIGPIHLYGVCLPSLKKRLGPSLSCRFLEYGENWKNLIGWFRRLETKEQWLSRFHGKSKPRIGV